MPLKWKLYYVCALYILLWSASIILYGVFSTLTDGFGGVSRLFAIVALTALGISAPNGAFSIRFLRHYRDRTLPSEQSRKWFIAGYCFTALMALGLLVLTIFVIIPSDFSGGKFTINYNNRDYKVFLIDFSFFIATVAAAVLAVLGRILLTTLTKRYYENLVSFGEDNEQP